MKKALYVVPALFLMLAAQGCSAKHGIGFVNNEVTWRQDFGQVKTEVSLGGSVRNNFEDYVNDAPGLDYKEAETGAIKTGFWLGIGCSYGLYSNDFLWLGAGLKYANNFKVSYDYEYYYYARIVSHKEYQYDDVLVFDYFSENKASLIFPQLEVKCPFSDNIRFTAAVELAWLKWRYNGGKRTVTFSQNVSQDSPYYTTYTESSGDTTEAPGAVNAVELGSALFYPGTVSVGILYYF